MRNDIKYRARALVMRVMVLALFAMPLSVFAQTRIAYHSNRYKVTDDVQIGRQTAAEAERQFPILRDEDVTGYVERVGQRLRKRMIRLQG